MAQVVNHRPVTAEVRVQSQASPCEICGGQVALGQVSLSISGFPCPYRSTFKISRRDWFLYGRQNEFSARYELRSKKQCPFKHISPSTKPVQEIGYLALYEISAGNAITRRLLQRFPPPPRLKQFQTYKIFHRQSKPK
jgi:hypothetical protein